MNKIKLIILITFILFLLTSCFNDDRYNLDESVISPTINKLSLTGTWIVRDKLDFENLQNLPSDNFNNIYITKELVEIGNYYTLSPKFESKYLNTKNYFGADYENFVNSDIINNENIEVIIISDEDGFYQEIVKLSEDEIFIVFNKERYILERESSSVDDSVLHKYENGNIKDRTESFYGKLGLNINIKYNSMDDSDLINTYYKTYYIYYDNSDTSKMIIEDFYVEDIFLSKKDNFNLIKYSENIEGEKFEGSLSDYIIEGENKLGFLTKFYSSSIPFELNYISSKYFSIISNDESNPSNKQYRIKEVNNKNGDSSLNIEDIAGEEGYKIIRNLINKEKETNGLNAKLNSPIDNYYNIGIVRNSGFWEFRTSLVLGEEPKLKYKEYTVNIIPNIDIAKNKVENLKWSEILKINPNATDVVYSPEKNFYIILDKDYIYFYNTNKVEPLIKIKMDESDKSIIKFDWILGTNADLWKENFLLIGRSIED